jgi:hypothetical protein
MGWVGCYDLHLYCDNYEAHSESDYTEYGKFPVQFQDEYGSRCRSRAKKAGWLFKLDGSVICPECSGKK